MTTCKVLVVDDEVPAAVDIGKNLRMLNGSPALTGLGIELKIELATSASWAWGEIDKQPGRWNVVVSDVMMPLENGQTQYKDAMLEGFQIHRVTGALGKACFAGGGFECLARPLEEARENDATKPWPRLVLTSNRLEGQERQQVDLFERDHSGWFRYLDKAERWHGIEHLYTFAVLQALSTYQQPEWRDEGFHPVTEDWRRLKLAVEQLATRVQLRHVLLLGPTGSGKSYLAQHLFRKCGITLEQGHFLDAAGLERKESVLLEHRSGTPAGLYIRRPDVLITTMQGDVHQWLKEDEDAPGELRRLCIWSAESWERIQQSAVLSDSLKSHFHGMEQLQVPPLTAANVAAHAEDLRQRLWPSYSFGDGVVAKLQATAWPFHVRSLRQALSRAVEAATQAGRTTLLPADFARHPPPGQPAPDYVAEMPQAAPTIDRSALVKELKQLRRSEGVNCFTADHVRSDSQYLNLRYYCKRNIVVFNKAMDRLKDLKGSRYQDIAELLMSDGSRTTHNYHQQGSVAAQRPDVAFATNSKPSPQATKKRSA